MLFPTTSFHKIFSSHSERKFMRNPVSLSTSIVPTDAVTGFRVLPLRGSPGMTLRCCIALAVALLACTTPALADTLAQPATTAAPITTPAKNLSASDAVTNFYTQLVAVMKQGEQLGFAGRFKKLDPALHQVFNLPLMARLSVGLVWNHATQAEQNQITQAFSTFSVATYASRFTHYNGEQFIVVDEKPVVDGTLVETVLKPKTGDSVSLNYLMQQDAAGAWRIVDVFMDGAISELATRRAEFSSVIKRDGINALVNSLDAKSKQMGPS